MKQKLSTLILLILFFVGLSVLLYPAISDFWNSKTQSQAIIDYESLLDQLPQEDYSGIFENADGYNRALQALDFPLIQYNQIPDYWNILDMNGNGMMGYIAIDKIGVELPIYLGTDEDVLNVAVGHVQGSSLPIGGESTHAVLSAHRGLPSAKLFTHLDRLEIGDTFVITVLDRVLTYQVDQIRIVLPDEVDNLVIADGQDYCTLLTCTPYGINTHRLLVRGRRIETIVHKTIHLTSEAYRIDTLIVTPIVALPMLFVLILIVVFKPPKKERTEEVDYTPKNGH